MKPFKLCFWIALLPVMISAQYNIRIEAFVLDEQTQQPIPYVNIGFEGKGIGTVSNQKGWFSLLYDENRILPTDQLQVSSIGYKTKQFKAKELYDLLTQTDKIYLVPKIEALDEVLVSSTKQIRQFLGYSSFQNQRLIAYWKDKEALGGEIGSLIRLRKKNTKLHKFSYNVLENTADSLLVRVNIYDYKRGKPGQNMLKTNIYHTITTKKGIDIIDLSPYNIIMQDDFVISIELVSVYGKDIQFAITAGDGGKIFLKYISQDNWDRWNNMGVAFKIESSYPDDKETTIVREKPDDIFLYWDTSISMKDRDVVQELKLLQKYTANINEVTITLLPFSDHLGKKEKFLVKNGNIQQVKEAIQKLTYNGASNFEELFKIHHLPNRKSIFIVSTDGKSTFGKLEPQYDIPVFYINSTNKGNHEFLKELGQFSDGHYLNLWRLEQEEALSYMLYRERDEELYGDAYKIPTLKGKVFANDNPLQGCIVSVKGTLIETETDENGVYKIYADVGDTLVFDHFGTTLVEKPVLSEKPMEVDLEFKYNLLEETYIESNNKDQKKESTNLGDFEIDNRKLGGAAYTLPKEQFPKSAIYLEQIIKGRFPGVRVTGSGNLVDYVVRGNNSINGNNKPLWVVDGIPYTEAPNFLTADQIEQISLVRSLAVTARYGALGVNGVFIIKTVFGSSNKNKKEKAENSLLVKGNDYTESVTWLDDGINKPDYLTNLLSTNSYAEAKTLYFQLQSKHEYEIPFYIYSADYFTRWDKEFAKQVLSNIAEVAEDNYKALRVLAFKLEENNDPDSIVIYEKLKELRPDYPQSYLDLARVYTLHKKYNEAYTIYHRMMSDQITGVSLDHCGELLLSQLGNFLNNHRSQLDNTLKIPKEYLSVRSVPARIVFDWNDPQAEFEIQFVSPKNKYFKWTHNFGNHPKEREIEAAKGVLSKEFIVDKAFDGQWIVNIKSLKTRPSSNNPVFMKYTFYRNYGLPEETKEVKFIKLYNHTEKVSLDKFAL